MKLYDLDDKNLQLYLESIPEKYIRDLFKKDRVLKSKIKGFRAEKCDINRLINISVEVIRKGQSYKYSEILNKFFEHYRSQYDDSVQKYIKNGYPIKYAKAQYLLDSLNDNTRSVYYILLGFDEKESREVEEIIQTILFLNNRFIRKDEEQKNKEIENYFNIIQKRIDDFTLKSDEKIKNISNKEILSKNEYNIFKNEYNLKLKEIEKENESLKKELAVYKKTINTFQKDENCIEKKQLSEIERKIKSLEIKIDNLLAENNKWEHLIYKFIDLSKGNTTVLNNQDDLDEIIYDLFGHNENFKSLREMVKEIIFNNKPIITDRRKSRILAEKLSLLVSGGILHEITLADNDYLCEFEKKINMFKMERSSVVLVKGLFSKVNYSDVVDLVSCLDNRHKFVFEIGYSTQLRYIPSELIEDFIFFDGHLDSRGESEIAYILDIDVNPEINHKYEKTLKELNLFLENSIYTKDLSGILGFNIIPFIHYNEGIGFDDILSRITDYELREKCREIVYNG